MRTYADIFNSNDLIAWIDLSTYCNASCPQCHRTKVTEAKGKTDWLPLIQWSLEQFKKAFPVEDLRKYKRFEFCGTWGDPVMNKDLFDIIDYIFVHNNTCTVQINTNGSIRDADWWWDLGVLGKRRLQVWFDVEGTTQEMHERYRQGTDLKKIKENIEAYTATGAEACAMVIIFEHNQEHLFEINDMLRELGVTGEILYTESNRFYKGPVFHFIDTNGKDQTLHQSTLNGEHPLIAGKVKNQIPIRDHKWRQKFVADGKKIKDYW